MFKTSLKMWKETINKGILFFEKDVEKWDIKYTNSNISKEYRQNRGGRLTLLPVLWEEQRVLHSDYKKCWKLFVEKTAGERGRKKKRKKNCKSFSVCY